MKTDAWRKPDLFRFFSKQMFAVHVMCEPILTGLRHVPLALTVLETLLSLQSESRPTDFAGLGPKAFDAFPRFVRIIQNVPRQSRSFQLATQWAIVQKGGTPPVPHQEMMFHKLFRTMHAM